MFRSGIVKRNRWRTERAEPPNHQFGNALSGLCGEVEMWWPFGRKNSASRMVPAPTVTLTDDEHQECEAYLKSVIRQSDQGAWFMPTESGKVFRRGSVAGCMIGLAPRFAL